MQRESTSQRFPLGSALPSFDLLSTDKRLIGSSYFEGAKASLVVFTCNHCPYVKGSELKLIEVVRAFIPKGLRAITISSNDALKYPEDSFEKMAEKSTALQLPYPYLYDESQAVAKQFDAACTPEAFLFDAGGALVYHGALNNSPRDPSGVTTDYLSPAIVSVLAGKVPSPQFVHPIGCSIKWK
jgi:peroxiredoxin